MKAVIFDLDDTLYQSDNGLWDAIRARMEDYAAMVAGVPADQGAEIKRQIYQDFPTLGVGLVMKYGADLADFYQYVHQVRLEDYLTPQPPELRAVLESIRLPKYILTNADRFHVARVLRFLGISDLIDAVFDIHDVFPNCKPLPQAFQRVLDLSKAGCAEECVFFDDQGRNVQGAHEMGFYTVQVATDSIYSLVDAHIERIEHLPTLPIYQELI